MCPFICVCIYVYVFSLLASLTYLSPICWANPSSTITNNIFRPHAPLIPSQ